MKSLAFTILFIISVGSTTNSLNQTDGKLGRIARGHDATAAQFPYIVKLNIRNYFCGAALIGVDWILTAAHCVYDATIVEVYLGSLYRSDAQVVYYVPVSNIKIHPRFDIKNVFNDIALVKIPITDLCDNIGIIPLPKIQANYPTYENEIAVGTGWGIINDENTSPEILQWGYMKILRNSKCTHIAITSDEICTAMSPDWATACEGDSGGPLVLESTYELIGIVSSGNQYSCESGKPAIYTRITSHLDWIKSVSGISY